MASVLLEAPRWREGERAALRYIGYSGARTSGRQDESAASLLLFLSFLLFTFTFLGGDGSFYCRSADKYAWTHPGLVINSSVVSAFITQTEIDIRGSDSPGFLL